MCCYGQISRPYKKKLQNSNVKHVTDLVIHINIFNVYMFTIEYLVKNPQESGKTGCFLGKTDLLFLRRMCMYYLLKTHIYL